MFLANGLDGYISKPIDIHQLNAVINKLVRDRYPAETVEAARRLKNNLKKDPEPRQPVKTELIKLFTRDAEKTIDILETIHKYGHYEDEDIQLYVINAHAMKSALANIRENELSVFAGKLEEAGRKRNITEISKETPVFLSALRTVIEKIKLNKDSADSTDSADSEAAGNILSDDRIYLLEKLSLIRQSCAEYNKKTAKDALAQLQQKKWPRPVNELLDTLAEHLLHSNFTEAAKLSRDYADTLVIK
jgi:HPt (histidine-containing phosphotransfer) domain-containing protein